MERADCSPTDRAALLPLIKQFQAYTTRARREGLLILEDYSASVHTPLFRVGLQLVIEGHAEGFIERVLLNTILSSGYQGQQLLEQLIIAEGLLGLVKRLSPQAIRVMLLSLLGEAFLETDLQSVAGQPSAVQSKPHTTEPNRPESEGIFARITEFFSSGSDEQSG